YKKAAFGPYAENLRNVLARIEGHLVSGYADGGDAPDKRLELVPGVVDDAATFLVDHPETRARFDRVADLVEGFATPFGMELLTTIHWVMTREGATSPGDAVQAAYRWNPRKRAFSERQIELAYNVLESRGWFSTAAPLPCERRRVGEVPCNALGAR